jgi:hypothetical protein
MTLHGFVSGDRSSGVSFPHFFVMKSSMTCSDPGYDFRHHDALAKYLAAPLQKSGHTRNMSSDPRARHSVAPQLHPRGLTA